MHFIWIITNTAKIKYIFLKGNFRTAENYIMLKFVSIQTDSGNTHWLKLKVLIVLWSVNVPQTEILRHPSVCTLLLSLEDSNLGVSLVVSWIIVL